MKTYIDSETCGLVGPMVLFQYAKGDGRVVLHEVWRKSARETLDLIEWLCDQEMVGFNLVFDWFHIQKLQNMLARLKSRQLSAPPTISAMAEIEREAPLHGMCVKPKAPHDVYLHLITGPFQSLMERKPIKIRRVPEVIAEGLVAELEAAIQFDWIYTKRKKEGPAWKVTPSKDMPGFVDLTFSFGASRTLKSIHKYVFGKDNITFPLPKEMYPVETQWSPYHDNVPGTWPDRIAEHIDYWHTNEEARKYGTNDIVMERDLHKKFGGTCGDMESVLACLVGSVRYRGFPIDIVACKREAAKSAKLAASAGNLDWRKVLPKLHELCTDPLEVSIITSTKDEALEPLLKWIGEDGKEGTHPVAKYAAEVRLARQHRFRSQWLEKLLTAGRFHPSLSPVGTLTRRASGSGGFNPQNIDHDPTSRSLFVLADNDRTLKEYVKWLKTVKAIVIGVPDMGDWKGCVGDFESMETVIAIAAWADEQLAHYVDEGIKPYHVFGSYLYRKELGDGDQKAALKALSDKKNKEFAYRSKTCWYALLFGAQEFKISQSAGLAIEEVALALKDMGEDCKGMSKGRQAVFDRFACLVQEYEHGPFHWNEPTPKIPNMQGWERDFSFEVGIIKSLWDMSKRLPRDWREIQQKVVRSNGREQTVYGAVCSAVFGAMKQMEARMKRQAGNCVMQSTCAMYCKDLETREWDIQPVGVHPWVVVLLNIHDEIDGAIRKNKTVQPIVAKALKVYAKKVPLVKMDWQEEGVHSWADKK